MFLGGIILVVLGAAAAGTSIDAIRNSSNDALLLVVGACIAIPLGIALLTAGLIKKDE